jgi:hypothetical protein
MKELSLPQGTKILCGNGHLVAVLNRSLYRGDTDYSDAFDYVEGQMPPTKGQLCPLHCHCGSVWLDKFKCVKIE